MTSMPGCRTTKPLIFLASGRGAGFHSTRRPSPPPLSMFLFVFVIHHKSCVQLVCLLASHIWITLTCRSLLDWKRRLVFPKASGPWNACRLESKAPNHSEGNRLTGESRFRSEGGKKERGVKVGEEVKMKRGRVGREKKLAIVFRHSARQRESQKAITTYDTIALNYTYCK